MLLMMLSQVIKDVMKHHYLEIENLKVLILIQLHAQELRIQQLEAQQQQPYTRQQQQAQPLRLPNEIFSRIISFASSSSIYVLLQVSKYVQEQCFNHAR
eukprot:Pgem_evm1s12788